MVLVIEVGNLGIDAAGNGKAIQAGTDMLKKEARDELSNTTTWVDPNNL